MMRKTIMRAVNNKNLETLKKVINQAIAEAPQYLEKLKKEQRKIASDKLERLNKWYMKIIGLDEVKIYQDRVTALQEQLLTTQTKRREINRQLSEIRRQAQDVQSQIQHIDRKEKFDVYCQLIKDEREIFRFVDAVLCFCRIYDLLIYFINTEISVLCKQPHNHYKILNLEYSVNATFQEYDQAERDLFTAFTNSVRDSQEKQRAQLEYAKYLGLVLSIIGSFLAFLYAFFWRQDLKTYINKEISSLKFHQGISISKDVEMYLKEIKQWEIQNYNEILNSRNDVHNVIRYLNSKGEKPIPLPLIENEPTEMPLRVLKYIGISFLGYIIFKSIFG
ncbi:uncharacterized protein LOC130448151 isoform X1 [Diorhabda sublineata]|uniref:uncharacterized protein LOC130448151 isoform X1 n=1 Tax=Diorhabda sublineata TaxID=1163346 RepID=UPI0024E060CC|nr:uncharacterized protein LOC130448151 isoform X1 [Diorhabda sublineata]XP_056641366.1 uncharacterized protein LOC130448151 isoform X1 [Diorhabda sublineata]